MRRKLIAGLAIAAGLVVPSTASAQVNVKAQYEQVDFRAPKQCITVDVKPIHSNVWREADWWADCMSHITFKPDTPDRNGKTYFKYRVRRVVLSGGVATVPPTTEDGFGTCFDDIDNDHDGKVDLADEDILNDKWTDADMNSECDRGVAPVRDTPTATLRTGWIRVKTDYWPNERVYQYVNGRFNDRFFNYCITKGKSLHSASHGRFYCIEPGFTYRNTALRKP